VYWPKIKKGIEKVAIYVALGYPLHAALQLESGVWASKCGIMKIFDTVLKIIRRGVIWRVALYLHREETEGLF